MLVYENILANEFNCRVDHVTNVINLIDEGNTIPFIARYRKELHGAMDDQKLRELADRLQYLRNLDKRKQEVRESIEAQGKLTDELIAAIDAAQTLAAVEDIYRPYKQKRRTRATVAREQGLEPLAEWLLSQSLDAGLPLDKAAEFIDEEKGIEDAESCIKGACDILAEDFSDDAALRTKLRPLLHREAIIKTEKVGEGNPVYQQYYEYEEPLHKIQPHRVLAINRGEKEGALKVTLRVPDDAVLNIMDQEFLEEHDSNAMEYIQRAIDDSWSRLLYPSMEREMRSTLSEGAQTQAIKMFAINLKQLLMQPPVRGQNILAVDPAYRTGCKCAVIDATGLVLDTVVVYPTPPESKIAEATATLTRLIKTHKVTVIAIGNGTASKETEIFIAELIKGTPGVSYMVVNEAGASVYSASKIAADEFPQFDVSIRSAVSIARRLQDPLAELVKVDPKSIGVGQYQHDMPPAQLSNTLDGVVEDCVNNVGVDLNVASAPLLERVAGLGPAIAKNVVTYREENGAFPDRKTLLKVPKLGPKAYEQCAGFLRIPDGKNVLDNTSVHPESYKAAKELLSTFGLSLKDVGKMPPLNELVEERGEESVAEACNLGVLTLKDVVASLQKPGRDPRDELPPPQLRTDVLDMKDLVPGMTLTGTVRNVIDFGAFVDIGVHQDGLVHISEIANRFIRHPSEVVKVGDIVNVIVLEVDVERKRIALSMKQASAGNAEKQEESSLLQVSH
ncbi:MAG: RNA-binding transcriptional accessory protein [Oscillospiraceae bacterium]|nr:RNA-binding transcriptional accessory protein [Oscillospiraceae bacterium]